jgi:hypothetical protein
VNPARSAATRGPPRRAARSQRPLPGQVARAPELPVVICAYADDGAEFDPDGKWIYCNSERASTSSGHARLFRVSVNGHTLEQLTHDERVNWFPHPSPDGSTVAYVSFPAGVRSPNWLTVLDNETCAVTANIAVGKDPHSVALPLQPDLERTDRRFSKSVSLFPI